MLELLSSDFSIVLVTATASFLSQHAKLFKNSGFDIIEVDEDELSSLGTFQSNNAALAVAKMKPNKPLYAIENEYLLALDNISDPGNLGTIIRIADWYGISKIICSEQATSVMCSQSKKRQKRDETEGWRPIEHSLTSKHREALASTTKRAGNTDCPLH